jgi:hypothetical protein
LRQRPSCTSRERSPSWRASAIADDQLRHAAGVGERRVEDRDAALVGGGQLDLVDADAEAADGEQPARFGERLLADPRLAADAEDVDVAQLLRELGFLEGRGEDLELEAFAADEPVRGGVDVFEEEELDLVHWEGRRHGALN